MAIAEEGSNTSCCSPVPSADVAPHSAGSTLHEGTNSVQYRISNMDCPTEERLIRNKLGANPAIAQLDFNLMSRVLTVHHQLQGNEEIVAALKSSQLSLALRRRCF